MSLQSKAVLQNLKRFFLAPVSSVRIDLFRVMTGCVLWLYVVSRGMHAEEWLTPAGYHTAGKAAVAYTPFLPLLPEGTAGIFITVFLFLIVLFILNWKIRWVSWAVLFLFTYVTYADELAFFSPNKLLIVSLLVICLTEKGNHWTARPDRTETTVSIWPVRILQITLITHFFMAGWTKIAFGDWLTNPYVVWTQMQGTYRTGLAAWMLNTLPPPFWPFLQYNALAFELLSPILFVLPGLRWIGIVWGSLFQIMIALTMHGLIYFNLIFFCFFAVFIDEKLLLKWERKWRQTVRSG